MSLCLSLSLTACGGTQPVRKVPVYLTPPGELTQGELEPEFFGTKNEDLLFYVDDLREWGGACQIDKASLREWAAKHRERDNGP